MTKSDVEIFNSAQTSRKLQDIVSENIIFIFNIFQRVQDYIRIFFQFHPVSGIYSRVGRGNLVLRHSVPHNDYLLQPNGLKFHMKL